MHAVLPILAQVGFRHAEIKGHQLLHNGQPITVKGRLRFELASWHFSLVPCSLPPECCMF